MFIAFVLPRGKDFSLPHFSFLFPFTYDSQKGGFLASCEFIAKIKGLEDVNKVSVKQEGEKPIKAKSLPSYTAAHRGTV